MNLAQIKVNFDVNDPKQVEALNAFLSLVGEGTADGEAPATTSRATTQTAKPAPAKTATKTTAKTAAKTAEAEDTDTSDEGEGEAPKIERLRELLTEKVDKHRAAIKAKLTEFDTNNLTNLDAKHYGAFLAFLTALK